MNATKIAKALVVLNVALAVAFLTWAIAVVTQKIDWFSPTVANGGEQVVGQLEKMAAQYKTLSEANDKAYSLWVNNKKLVDVQERERPLRRDFYRAQLATAQTGTAETPFLNFPAGPDGLMSIAAGANRSPIFYKPGTPLLSIKTYQTRIADLTANIKSVKGDIAKLIDELKGENDRIYDANGNGLRKLIREQEEILNAARLEREYLGTSNANLQADTTLFTKRLDALKARLLELERARGALTSAVLGTGGPQR